jgi:Ser/Thr protein kinase RdoA (MazF antagonist)
MAAEWDVLSVLAAYPDDCRPAEIEPLGAAGGFSGARFWRVSTRAGEFCLRRWPRAHPSAERLEFIQAVLWHVVCEGFELAPLPLCTRSRKGYVRRIGYFWELAPWMPGRADFRESPTDEKLTAAMAALADFHLAAATFPLPDPPVSRSPGIRERRKQLQAWISGDLDRLAAAVQPGLWPALECRAAEVLRLVRRGGDRVLELLDTAAQCRVPLQPCIRDVWHNHVLFEGSRVSGLIDFGSMGTDNVSADVARLLGSMAGDDPHLRRVGLDAYRSVRPLSQDELSLIHAFDRSTVLMAGLTWIDWVYRQRRAFENPESIPRRLDEIIERLEHFIGR